MDPCPACTKPVSPAAVSCPHCGHPLGHPTAGSDAVSTIIPYKNGMALAAYYLGVFSLIPCIGAILGILSIVFGCLGLKAAAKNPQVKGKVHAWVGIIIGAVVLLGHVAVGVMAGIAANR